MASNTVKRQSSQPLQLDQLNATSYQILPKYPLTRATNQKHLALRNAPGSGLYKTKSDIFYTLRCNEWKVLRFTYQNLTFIHFCPHLHLNPGYRPQPTYVFPSQDTEPSVVHKDK